MSLKNNEVTLTENTKMSLLVFWTLIITIIGFTVFIFESRASQRETDNELLSKLDGIKNQLAIIQKDSITTQQGQDWIDDFREGNPSVKVPPLPRKQSDSSRANVVTANAYE